MIMKKLHFWTLIFLLSISSVSWAQTSVAGKILNEQGIPLIGATVLEIGTTNGTTTDFDGNFSLTVSEDATLEISYLGYT